MTNKEWNLNSITIVKNAHQETKKTKTRGKKAQSRNEPRSSSNIEFNHNREIYYEAETNKMSRI